MCCGDGRRRFFDRLLDNRQFFDGRRFGNDHDRRCFINNNGRRWFNFDNGWRRDDGDRNLDGFLLDDWRRCGAGRSNRLCRLYGRRVRLDGLDESRWTEDRCRRLGWFGLLRRRRFLQSSLGWNGGVLGEHVAARQRDASLPRQPLDERARNDFLDCARGALQPIP
jgi:hypothetical protein